MKVSTKFLEMWFKEMDILQPRKYFDVNARGNFNAITYYEISDIQLCHQQPFATKHLTDAEIEDCRTNPLVLNHPCHNQTCHKPLLPQSNCRRRRLPKLLDLKDETELFVKKLNLANS